MRQFIHAGILLQIALSTVSYANPTFLDADQAFQFSAESLSQDTAQLNWNIAPHYYLYHQQFQVTTGQHAVRLDLPNGHQKNDPTFGMTEVHYGQVQAQFNVKPNTSYRIEWQGCSQDGLCYPLQSTEITTDADGLLPQRSASPISQPLQTLNLSPKKTALQDQEIAQPPIATETKALKSEPVASSLTPAQDTLNTASVSTAGLGTDRVQRQVQTSSLQWNDDQSFFNLLSKDNIVFNLLIFFALGILLAFLPCSLPLIPIISSLIIQKRTGYKALAIVSSFILSMAVVYGIMGMFVAEIGYSFQRWFQNPILISVFALLFVFFAFNLFGAFQLSLPQAWINKLNQFQDRQHAGTLIGSISMGALSALIVGPCMSAPLAGALLFVSQTHHVGLGGLYLFMMGLGIGLPLFIVSMFGNKLLPKPGIWMNHLKVCFGFMMLVMAVYFLRPMLSHGVYPATLGLIVLLFAGYLVKVITAPTQLLAKLLITGLIFVSVIFAGWQIKSGYSQYQASHRYVSKDQLIVHWQKVRTTAELEHAFKAAQAQQRAVIMDVYADWCVACQPLEKEVFPRTDVQQALQGYALIQLDLSDYDPSQDALLKKFEILGPPTLLFFDTAAQEQRDLRLTGAFKAEQLIKQLQQMR